MSLTGSTDRRAPGHPRQRRDGLPSQSQSRSRTGSRRTGRPSISPLGQALREYGGAANQERLPSLFLPVQRAAERCAWLKQMAEGTDLAQALDSAMIAEARIDPRWHRVNRRRAKTGYADSRHVS